MPGNVREDCLDVFADALATSTSASIAPSGGGGIKVYSEALRQLIAVVTSDSCQGDVRSSFVRRCTPEIVARLAGFASNRGGGGGVGEKCNERSRLNEQQVSDSVKLLRLIAEHSVNQETRLYY